MIGQQIGTWIVDVEIGQDDLGRLYHVHAVDSPERTGLLKTLTHPKSLAPDFSRLFLAQIELLRKLRHPAILSVLDGGEASGTAYYVQDDPHGSDLQTLMRDGEKFTWEQVLAIALQIVPALRYAHRRSVLHRDLKPANVYRCGDGSYKLAGFGIMKFLGEQAISGSSDLLGSAAFMSPEQAAGKPHTKRSDFYSLGCLLYALVVGRPPFTGGTLVELSHKHCYVLPERATHLARELPEEFDRFIMKLLVKEPAQRPGSGTALIQEIEGIWTLLERRGQLGPRPPRAPADTDDVDADAVIEPRLPEPVPRAPTPWLRRWYVLAPMLAGCVLVLGWAFFWRGPSADELMARARPLLASDQPADWERAWDEYLEPLSRKYPGKYRDEVQEARRRIEQQGDLRRAFVIGAAVRHKSPAERFYQEGVRLTQGGEFAAARHVWNNAIVAFSGVAAEQPWVALAKEAIERLDATERTGLKANTVEQVKETLGPTLARIEAARLAGRTAEADAMARALLALYRDDADLEIVRELLKPSP